MIYYFIGKRETDIQGAFFYSHRERAMEDLDSYIIERNIFPPDSSGLSSYIIERSSLKLFEVEITECPI